MSTRAIFYGAPAAKRLLLPKRPQLASWDKAGTPSQQRLAAYLKATQQVVDPVVRQLRGPLALRLDVGLPRSVDLLAEHDLDNYLSPLMKALDAERRIGLGVQGPRRRLVHRCRAGTGQR
jgi:hypothetical protein